MVRPLFAHAHAFRSTVNDLAAGYLARYQNWQSKASYVLPDLEGTPAITVYGVASRSQDTNPASNIMFLVTLTDYNDNSSKQDLCLVADGSNYGVKGLCLNSYTSAFTGMPTVQPALAVGKLFQYTVRFYNSHPEQFRLRVNGQELAIVNNGSPHASRAFSKILTLGGDPDNSSLNWIGSLNDTVLYLGDQPSATDTQNEAYLMGLYNIT